jgi:transposase InsO family protein
MTTKAQVLPPDLLQDLLALQQQISASAHGAKGKLIAAFAQARHTSAHTVYKWLALYAGYSSGRKKRDDAGTTRLPDETLNFIAASVNESVRNNGISTKPICVAMNIAHENGLTVNVSEGRISALMRAKRLDVSAQSTARNHQKMRSLYPNHVHQIDPSLCLIYYMGGRQHMMREQQFNKNKPVSIEKVKLKVWRYVRYDHASGSIDVRYFEAAGENQHSLFEFLLHTWGRFESRLSHGVPEILLWDKGSANTSAGIKRMLDALGVKHETHATHHAWVKGGVESGNWIVERHLESRLKDEPVTSIEQLNASAAKWVRDYNANNITHVDCRICRDDGVPHVRDDLWNLIAHHPHVLREMPGREVCGYFMRGKEETRVIRDGHISFVHPLSGKSESYNLQAWAKEFANGEKVLVSPMLLGECVVRIEIDRFGKEPLQVEVEAVRNFDNFGRPLAATVIGQERRQAPHTAATEASKVLAQAAYGAGASLEDAEAARNKNVRPFQHLNEGRGVIAHSHLGKTELPQRLLPTAQILNTPEVAAARGAHVEVAPLNQVEAAKQIKSRLGDAWQPIHFQWLAQRFPDGVPPEQIDRIVAELSGPAAAHKQPFKVLTGGAS